MVILEVVTMLTKDVIEFIVPLKKGKDDIIPCLYERSFAYLFDQDLDNLGLLLKDILDLDEEDLKGNIIKLSNNLDINHKKDKYRKMDFVYRIKNKKIDGKHDDRENFLCFLFHEKFLSVVISFLGLSG